MHDGGVWKIPVLANPGDEGDADGISSCRGRVRIEVAAQNDWRRRRDEAVPASLTTLSLSTNTSITYTASWRS
jgi:hypothetical protein